MYVFYLTVLTEIAEGEKDGMRARVLSVSECVECVCVSIARVRTSTFLERYCHDVDTYIIYYNLVYFSIVVVPRIHPKQEVG